MTNGTMIETASQTIEAKIKQIQAPAVLKQWHFRLVNNHTLSQPHVMSAWQEVSLPYSWSSADGEGWFKTSPLLLESIEGICLEGSKVEFEFFLPIGAGIQVNGKEMFRDSSWTDSRAVRLVLADHYLPGSPLDLEVHCNASDGLAQFFLPELKFTKLSEVVFDLDLVRGQISFCEFLAKKGEEASPKKESILNHAVASLNFDALEKNDWESWLASVTLFRNILAPFETEAKKYTAFLVGHSHIDMNWLWPLEETLAVCKRDFSTMVKLMEGYPEFHFSQSQTATYRFIETRYPDLFEKINQRIASGQWEVTASTWVEGDLNLAAGESLARQLLHARRYAYEHFGAMPAICWEPDTFGHPATLPQLLKKSGVEYYYFCRCGKDQPLFWWEGLDGSRLLAVQEPQWYLGTVNPSSIVKSVLSYVSRYGTHQGLLVFGVGDHGGGATVADILTTRQIKSSPLMPDVVPSSARSFYEESLKESPTLTTIQGELNTTFEGCYTSHADIKRLNRMCENNLLTAETLAALAAVLTDSPSQDLAGPWQTLCFHQFHDILCGCAIQVTYREAGEKLEQVLSIAQKISKQAVLALSDHLNTGSGERLRLVVFNPLASKRTDIVRVAVKDIEGELPKALADESGRIIPVQISGSELIFIAEEIPALGMRVYRPVDTTSTPDNLELITDPEQFILENGLVRLQVHPETGALVRLVDLENNRDLTSSSTVDGIGLTSGILNHLQICWEEPHGMSAWVIGKISHTDDGLNGARVRVVENGPVRAVIETILPILSSSLTQRVVLYRKMRRVDFETEVDWHEKGNAHSDAPMLRVAFSPDLRKSKATFEIPFAGLERPANGNEVPALRWIDLSEEEGGYGFALLNNCKYGHQVKDNTLSMTLVRASYEPDLNPDEGLHRFTYAIYPHSGNWQQAEVLQQAAGLNQPLLSYVSKGHSGDLQAGISWVTCNSDSIILSALKTAEDQPDKGKAIIVRLYESSGKKDRVTLNFNFPVIKIEETDLLERSQHLVSQEKNSVTLEFTPFEIKTLKVFC
jgi:alpha-mannosidase